MNENRKHFSDQIKVLMDEYGTGQLASLTGISDTMLRKWRAGTSLPGLDKLIAITNATGVSLEWLVYGDDYPCLNTETFTESDKQEQFAYINMYDAEVSMGSGAWNDDERVINQLAFRKDWLKQEGLTPDHCAAIIAKGDSMEDTIKDGSTLLVDLNDNTISRDGVYVIRFDGHLLAKRLQRSFDGSIIIKSDNPAYSKIMVPKEQVNELQIVGRVVWHASVI